MSLQSSGLETTLLQWLQEPGERPPRKTTKQVIGTAFSFHKRNREVGRCNRREKWRHNLHKNNISSCLPTSGLMRDHDSGLESTELIPAPATSQTVAVYKALCKLNFLQSRTHRITYSVLKCLTKVKAEGGWGK